MEDYDIRSAASILASVKEQEARFERLTRALEEERRNVSLQLERANQPSDRVSICNIGNGQPLATAWQQLVLQVTGLLILPLTLHRPSSAFPYVKADRFFIMCVARLSFGDLRVAGSLS